MRRAEKDIIRCAITGSIHTPSMSRHPPVTPGQIASDTINAADAGATILHLHACGGSTQVPSVFRQFLPVINRAANLATGDGLGMSLDERLAAVKWAKLEMASMNMGSLNFNVSGAGLRIKTFENDWEKPYLEMTKDSILSNTFAQIERGIGKLSAL